MLDCKVEEDQPIIDKLPSILDHLCEVCKPHFDAVQRYLTRSRNRLTRSSPAWCADSITTCARRSKSCTAALGAQNSVLGGGRYDGLAESLGSKVPAPGIGFSIGEDRLVMSVENGNPADARSIMFIVAAGRSGRLRACARLAAGIARGRHSVELLAEGKLKRAMELANKLDARFALIVGENEIAPGNMR